MVIAPRHGHSEVCHDNWSIVSPGLAFADPAFHLSLFVVELVVGVVSPPGCRCYHCSGLTGGIVGGIFCKARETEGQAWRSGGSTKGQKWV